MFDDYTVTTPRDVEAIVKTISKQAEMKGFQILHIHDVQANLAQHGFHLPPIKIIELCRPTFADKLLATDIRLSVIMPCRIVVRADQGQTVISALRPRALGQFYPELVSVVAEEDNLMCRIVDESK
jgi:uncharacterized protein (DUF302 family)